MLKSLVIGLGSAGTRHFEILNNLGHEVATVSKRNDINGLRCQCMKHFLLSPNLTENRLF